MSSTLIVGPTSGTVQRKDYPSLLDKTIDVMWVRMEDSPTVLAKYFNKIDVPNGSGDTWKVEDTGKTLDMPVRSEDTAAKPFAQPSKGYGNTATLYPYRMFIRVTDIMMRTIRFPVLNEIVGGAPEAAAQKLEYLRAVWFNTNLLTGTEGADNLPLADNSHPCEDPKYGVWDNLSTGPLGVDNLHAMRLTGMNRVNDKGRPWPLVITNLLINPALQRTAEELGVAKLDPETTLNTPQVLINDIGYEMSHHLTSTAQYNGFGSMTKQMEKGIHECMLIAPTMDNDTSGSVDIPIQKRIKFMVGFTATTAKNVVVSAGT